MELIGCFSGAISFKAGSSKLLEAFLHCHVSASTCDFVQTMFVNKNYLNKTSAAGAWRMGGESCTHVVPGFPLGPGCKFDFCVCEEIIKNSKPLCILHS